MKISQYLVDKLIEYGVTDVFGIPGGVILDFIYELNNEEDIKVHLNYHEQAAAYAACGYAQASGRLGVAYATKGPGFTNMVTAIAEAYYDSLPVLFITSHSQKILNEAMRIEDEQEMNHVRLVSDITKYARRIDNIDEAFKAIDMACQTALQGRKGPVFLDFNAKVLKSEINFQAMDIDNVCSIKKTKDSIAECIACIETYINNSKRPVFLIGDGIRISGMEKNMQLLSENTGIPVLSSRFSQDILFNLRFYYGYIGSHGLRYSNFILSKADVIIALGNRMAFPVESKSFYPIVENSQIIRIDVDNDEFFRNIPNSKNFCLDLKELIPNLLMRSFCYKGQDKWLNICNEIKEELKTCDVSPAVHAISKMMQNFDKDGTIVCDIGNNELWSSRAYALVGEGRKLLHSKVFKTVGSAIGKAIGAYYASGKPVLCIVGDQGFQFNLQELQYIVSNQIPIIVVVCNNNASGMLCNSERQQGYEYYLHTTLESGYSHPDFRKIANAFGIKYTSVCEKGEIGNKGLICEPEIAELIIDENEEILQYLPKGNPCQKFVPELKSGQYEYLDSL